MESQSIDRTQGLGASDAAAACGLSKWKTPFELWREKVGTAPPESEDNALAKAMGKTLEPLVLELFRKKSKLTLGRYGQHVVDTSWRTRWVTLDAMASDGGVVEAKSVGFADPAEWGDEFEDSAIPMQYLLQCQHAMACAEAPHAWVPVVVLNRSFRLYRVPREQELIDLLTAKERDFWGYVERREPPPPISLEDAYRQWPQDSGYSVYATPEIVEQVGQLKVAKQLVKDAEFAEELVKAKITKFMGTAAALLPPNAPTAKPLVTWKTAQPSVKVDLDKLRAAHPDIVKTFEYQQPGSRRLLVK